MFKNKYKMVTKSAEKAKTVTNTYIKPRQQKL